MEVYELFGELEGFAYQQLLNWALEECDSFSLVTREGVESQQEQEFNQRLKPFLLKESKVNEWPGTKVFGPANHLLRLYRLNRESVKILSEEKSVYAWLAPRRPEDIAFYKTDNLLWFGSVAHERMAFFDNPTFNKGEVQKRLIDTVVVN